MITAFLMTSNFIWNVAARGAMLPCALISIILSLAFVSTTVAADATLRSYLDRTNCTTFSIILSATVPNIATFEINCGNSGHDIRTVYCTGISCRENDQEQSADDR